MKKIEVVPYNPQWPSLFEYEAQIIKQALDDNCIAIHHVGSTSVPGLCAKPKIDIIAVVKNPLTAIETLETVGFKYKGEYNIPLHYSFTKRGSVSINLHVYEENHPEIELNLLFRDYLRNHTEARQEYAALKLHLVSQEASHEKLNSRFTGYNLGKNAFIQKILKQAGFNRLCVRACTHYAEWEAYNRLMNHPPAITEYHHHFVLYKGTNIRAAAHVEFLDPSQAIIRSLAADELFKQDGYDAYIQQVLEKWIRHQGRSLLVST